MKKIFPTWLVITFVVISFIGFLDSSYLTANHYGQADLGCSITGGCDEVTNSPYSEVFGIPVAVGGIIYYLSVLILSLLYIERKSPYFQRFMLPLTALGFLVSLYFTYLQAFVIGAYCQYCLLSALNSTILFVLSLAFLRRAK